MRLCVYLGRRCGAVLVLPHSGPGRPSEAQARQGRLKKWRDEWLTPCDNMLWAKMGVCSITGDLCGATLVLHRHRLWTLSGGGLLAVAGMVRPHREQAGRSPPRPSTSSRLTLIRVYQQRVSVRLPARCSFPQTCSHDGLGWSAAHGWRPGCAAECAHGAVRPRGRLSPSESTRLRLLDDGG
jgi:hypothetical protein